MPRVVILGSGWGALSMLRKLHTDKMQVTVVSPRNYFLMTPLLASTTVGTVSQRSIVEPIRGFLARAGKHEASFIEAEAVAIDFKQNTIRCQDNSAVRGEVYEFDLPYDHLVIAVGCESATFGIPGVAENAIYMKEIDHSYKIRDRILDSLETACIPGQPEAEIERLLHFVVVGGGPSGVEFAAELHDFIGSDVVAHYPELLGRVKVTLIEATKHVLSSFSSKLIEEAEQALTSEKVNLMLNSAVKKVEDKVLVVQNTDGTRSNVPYGCLVWVAGNATRKLIKDASAAIGPEVQRDRRGLLVDEHLRVKGTHNVWALGDCAIAGFAPTAQVAYQEGVYLGRLLNALDLRAADSAKGKEGFKYVHKGAFAYVGDRKAIAQLPSAGDWSGQGTYFLWRTVYFSKLLSYKNRFLVLTDVRFFFASLCLVSMPLTCNMCATRIETAAVGQDLLFRAGH